MYSVTQKDKDETTRPDYSLAGLYTSEGKKKMQQTYCSDVSDDEKRVIGHIMKRWYAMDTHRSRYDTKWQLYTQVYDAEYVPYKDGRAGSNVPLGRSLVELCVNEMMKRKTQKRITPKYGEEFQAKMLDRVWTSHWRDNKVDIQIKRNHYKTCILGMGVMENGFERNKRYIHDIDVDSVDVTGEYKFSKKLETTNNIYFRNIDPRYVWFDERADHMDEVVDCIKIEFIPYTVFQNLKLDDNYHNIDKVCPMYSYKDTNRGNYSQLEPMSEDGSFVKVTKFWDEQADAYIEMANDCVIIRKHYIMNAMHRIPFSTRVLSERSYGLSGIGLIETAAPFISSINEFREQMHEAVRRSNKETILIGPGLEFVGGEFAFNNELLAFDGQFAGNYQQVTGTPPNQSLVLILQEMYKEIAMYCGIDIRNVLGDPAQTAYQTAVQEQTKNSRVANWITNAEEMFERGYRFYRDDLQMYFPRTLAVEIANVDETTGQQIVQLKKSKKGVPFELKDERIIKTGKGFVIQKAEGTQVFQIEPEHLRTDSGVEVYTDLTSPTMPEVKKAQILDLFKTIPLLAGAYNTPGFGEILKAKLPPQKMISQLFDLFGVDYDNIETEQKEEARKALDEFIKGISGEGMPGGTGSLPP